MPRARTSEARAGRRGQQAHDPQQEELAAAGRRLAQALDGLLEVVRAALGQRQRRVGHAAQLHALLGPRRGDRALEVGARGRRVVALGGPRAEDRLRGGPELLLALQLLVAARLERLHGGELAGLGDLDLALLGRHGAANLLHRPAGPGRGLHSPAMAPRAASLLALAALLAALAAPGRGARAEHAPSLGAPEPEETTPAPGHDTTTRATTAWRPGSRSLIFAAGIVLLGGIAAGDHQRRPPQRARPRPRRRPRAPAGGRRQRRWTSLGHRHRQATKQRARQKARAARAAAAAQPLAPGHVDVAGAQRAALRGQARALEAHLGQRLAALARRRRVAAPTYVKRRKSSAATNGCPRRPTAVPAWSRTRPTALDGHAVVAPDRLAQVAVVGHRVAAAQERPAHGAGDRARRARRRPPARRASPRDPPLGRRRTSAAPRGEPLGAASRRRRRAGRARRRGAAPGSRRRRRASAATAALRSAACTRLAVRLRLQRPTTTRPRATAASTPRRGEQPARARTAQPRRAGEVRRAAVPGSARRACAPRGRSAGRCAAAPRRGRARPGPRRGRSCAGPATRPEPRSRGHHLFTDGRRRRCQAPPRRHGRRPPLLPATARPPRSLLLRWAAAARPGRHPDAARPGRRPRVRVVSGLMFFPRGGSAHVARALAHALPAHGWDVTVVSGSLAGPRRRARVLRRPRRPAGRLRRAATRRCTRPTRIAPARRTRSSPRSTTPRTSARRRLGARAASAPARPRPTSCTCTTSRRCTRRRRASPPACRSLGHLHGTELLMLEEIAAGAATAGRTPRPGSERMRRWAAGCERMLAALARPGRARGRPARPRRRSAASSAPTASTRETLRAARRRPRRALAPPPRRRAARLAARAGRRAVGYTRRGRRAPVRGPVSLARRALHRGQAHRPARPRVRPRPASASTSPRRSCSLGGFPGEWEGEHPADAIQATRRRDVFLAGWHAHDVLPDFLGASDADRPGLRARAVRLGARGGDGLRPAADRRRPPRPGRTSSTRARPAGWWSPTTRRASPPRWSRRWPTRPSARRRGEAARRAALRALVVAGDRRAPGRCVDEVADVAATARRAGR